MSDTQARHQAGSGLALGTETFAGIMLATVATFQILEGIAAVAEDSVFVKGPNYTYAFDVTTWGWIHILLGVIGLAVGIGILTGQVWARVLGIFIAFLGALGTFAFMPYYPVWALVVLGMYVLVIWALCRQVSDEAGPVTL
jgi:hypothetical protein